jgi:hypothetical protein
MACLKTPALAAKEGGAIKALGGGCPGSNSEQPLFIVFM